MRYALTIAVIIFVVLSAQAQRFKGHLIGGFNMAQIDGDRLAGYNKIGVNGGIGVATILSERWQISTEFAFSQLGALRSRNDDPASIYDKIALNTVEVPFLIHFLDWKFHFKAGLTYNRLISYEVIDVTGENITDLSQFNNNNLAVTVGATYFWNERWGFDFRWSKAITDLESDPDNSSLINKWISFKAIYVF
jgi:hypothetical protein